jgi:hypothetical protein
MPHRCNSIVLLAEFLIALFGFSSLSPEQLEKKTVSEKRFFHLLLVLCVWEAEACVLEQ